MQKENYKTQDTCVWKKGLNELLVFAATKVVTILPKIYFIQTNGK